MKFEKGITINTAPLKNKVFSVYIENMGKTYQWGVLADSLEQLQEMIDAAGIDATAGNELVARVSFDDSAIQESLENFCESLCENKTKVSIN
jgi:hypothetical protein